MKTAGRASMAPVTEQEETIVAAISLRDAPFLAALFVARCQCLQRRESNAQQAM
jgi:hypothetical protein